MPRRIEVAPLLSASSLTIYGLFSFITMGCMIYKALHEQENALIASSWINNNNGCLAIVVNFIIASLIISGRIVQCIVLGTLRQTEAVMDSFLFVLFEWFFNFFQFLPTFDLRYFVISALIFYMEIFQKFLTARIDTMGQLPSIPKLFHVRLVSLFLMLQCFYTFFVPVTFLFMLQDVGPKGILICFLAEVVLNQLDLSAQLVTYLCNVYDANLDDPWEAKSRVLFYVGFIRDLAMFVAFPACIAGSLYLAPVRGEIKLPYHGFRIMFSLGYSLYTKSLKLIRFRAATRDMENKYPRVSDDQVSEMRDRTCIICREEFQTGTESAMDVPRKLPCGHVFHHRCLHSWLERQQSCPTCRMDVLKKEDATSPNVAAQAQNPEEIPGGAREQAQQQQFAPNDHQRAPQATLHELLRRFQGPDIAKEATSAAESAYNFLQEVRPELADELVDRPSSSEPNASSESVREAVRRATLQRFHQAQEPVQNSASPVLIPLFDPAKIPNFTSKHQPQLPYPLVDWVSTNPMADTASNTTSMTSPQTNHLDSLVKEKLAALQEAEALIERAKTELTTMIHPSPAPSKGKARERDSP